MLLALINVINHDYTKFVGEMHMKAEAVVMR